MDETKKIEEEKKALLENDAKRQVKRLKKQLKVQLKLKDRLINKLAKRTARKKLMSNRTKYELVKAAE